MMPVKEHKGSVINGKGVMKVDALRYRKTFRYRNMPPLFFFFLRFLIISVAYKIIFYYIEN